MVSLFHTLQLGFNQERWNDEIEVVIKRVMLEKFNGTNSY